MLVKCPDCGRDVSSLASACPGCARPMRADPIQQRHTDTVQTVERTSREWKMHILLASLTVIVGVVWLIAAMTGYCSQEQIGWSMLLLIPGVIWYVLARVGAWWHHG